MHVEEDIEERIYSQTEDGKTDYSIPPKRDVNIEILDQFSMIMEDLIYYRVENYNSTCLIEKLFEKLPDDLAQKLISKLNEEYLEY